MVMNKINLLKEKYSNCQLCPELSKSRSQVVFGTGDEKAEMLIIGEAPGAKEDQLGIPFCGASGKILEGLLESINLTRNDVFISNTILCRPEKNRNPKSQEIKNCNNRLNNLIEAINPTVIVTVGNFATKTIIGKSEITKIRGQIFKLKNKTRDYKVIPVIHPANYLYQGRNPQVLEQMKQDFKIIKKVVDNSM